MGIRGLYHTMETHTESIKRVTCFLLMPVIVCFCDSDTYVSGSRLWGFKTLQMQLQGKRRGAFFPIMNFSVAGCALNAAGGRMCSPA